MRLTVCLCAACRLSADIVHVIRNLTVSSLSPHPSPIHLAVCERICIRQWWPRFCVGSVYVGGVVAGWVGRRTCDQEVAVSTPGLGATLGKLFTPLCPCHKEYNLVPVSRRWRRAAGKITVSLASHWPCVSDFSGLTTYGLNACVREVSISPRLQWTTAPFTFALAMYTP